MTFSSSTILTNLKTWVEKSGGSVHPSLILQESSSGDRGLFARHPIPKGELLIQIPPKLVISGEKLPSKFKERNASPWLRCLACLYLAQDDPDWKPYMESLPESYDTLLQWTDEEAGFLAGTTLGATLKADRDDSATQSRYQEYVTPYLKYLKIPIDRDQSPIKVFEKISMCFATRGFHMQPSDQDVTPNSTAGPYLGPFLLPVMDLLNHTDSPTRQCTTFQRDPESKAFYMMAERDVQEGEEVFHSYGDKLTAAQLLQTFGFVPDTRMGDDYPSPKTPAIFSREALIEACTSVKQSTYPKELKDTMQQSGMEGDAFDLPSSTKKRDVSHLPDQFVVDASEGAALSDEIVTLCAIQMLPDEVYEEVGQDLLQPEILEDYFLGKLVAMALLNALKTKLATYTALPMDKNNDDKALLQQLQQQSTDASTTRRALYALVLRLEEKSALEALKKEVLALIASLEEEDGEDDEEGEDALQQLLQQRMESKPPAKKQKKSSE